MTSLEPRFAGVSFPPAAAVACPIDASLGLLGRKWALLVLRDVAFYRGTRFRDILRMNPGLTPRMLSRRLAELVAAGLIERRAQSGSRAVVYELLPKGRDVVPALAALMHFGVRHHASEVFPDGRPRKVPDLFPSGKAALLQGLAKGPWSDSPGPG